MDAIDSKKQTGNPAVACVKPCIHCGQATECTTVDNDQDIFCCNGCRAAYSFIQGLGLGSYYSIRDQLDNSPQASVKSSDAGFDQFDEPQFLGPSTPRECGDGLQSTEFSVQNLHCAACSWLIENVANQTPGWMSARVNMSDHSVKIIYDANQLKLSRIAALMGSLGYALSPIDRSHEHHNRLENRRLLTQIAIAGFIAANGMWIAVAIYAGEMSWVAAEHHYFLGLVGAALGAWSMFGPGRTFLRGAWASLRTGTPHMDLPISIGLFLGAILGVVNAVRGVGDIYFDSIAALIFFLLIGRWVQFRQQYRAARAVDLMLRITPRHTHVVTADGQTQWTLVDNLQPGQTIRVAAGESLAADGVVIAGNSALDRSLLTGESNPVRVFTGDVVAAGTVNLTAPIDVRVTTVGDETRVGRVMQAVEQAATQRTPIVQLADRVGIAFVIGITLLGTLAFVLWMPAGLGRAANVATSLLIVACPCGLALATPLAIAVALGRAAKSKILIRDGETFQRLSTPGRIWLDKTGTLTEGKIRVRSVIGEPHGLQLASSIEQHSVHPIALAICRESDRRKQPALVGELIATKRGGIVGTVGQQSVLVGNEEFITGSGIPIDVEWRQQVDRALARGESPILVAVDGKLETLLGLCDPLKDDALMTVNKLKEAGWKPGILSGDHPQVVRSIALQLGLPENDCFGGLAPEEKLAAVRESKAHRDTVIMVGDGANDAAALAAADVGIAVRGGAEVSLHAAPVYIANGELASIAKLVRASSATTRVVYLTFAVSLAYNVIAVGLSLVGQVSPLVAAIIMPASSVSVLGIVIGINTFAKERS